MTEDPEATSSSNQTKHFVYHLGRHISILLLEWLLFDVESVSHRDEFSLFGGADAIPILSIMHSFNDKHAHGAWTFSPVSIVGKGQYERQFMKYSSFFTVNRTESNNLVTDSNYIDYCLLFPSLLLIVSIEEKISVLQCLDIERQKPKQNRFVCVYIDVCWNCRC